MCKVLPCYKTYKLNVTPEGNSIKHKKACFMFSIRPVRSYTSHTLGSMKKVLVYLLWFLSLLLTLSFYTYTHICGLRSAQNRYIVALLIAFCSSGP